MFFVGDPNKERTRLLRDGPRYLDSEYTGNAARDGYTCIGRRPRVQGFDEIVPTERADRLESFERELRSLLDRTDY